MSEQGTVFRHIHGPSQPVRSRSGCATYAEQTGNKLKNKTLSDYTSVVKTADWLWWNAGSSGSSLSRLCDGLYVAAHALDLNSVSCNKVKGHPSTESQVTQQSQPTRMPLRNCTKISDWTLSLQKACHISLSYSSFHLPLFCILTENRTTVK